MYRHIRCYAKALLAVGLLILGPAQIAWAATGAYPQKEVRMIVPAPPGSGPDTLARLVSQQLSEKWKRPVIIENITGAGGVIGHDRAAKADPDGYTLLMGLIGPMSVSSHLRKDMPYDPVKDLAPVTLLVTLPNILAVNPSVPVKNLKELIAYAKENPDKVRYGFPGYGTSLHLAAELFNMMADTKIQGVPYTTSSQMTVDAIGGRIEMIFHNVPVILPHIQSGSMRAIGITSKERNDAAPNIPTLDESGLKDYEITSWYGMWVPAGTPESIIKKLNTDIAQALQHPDIERWMKTQAGTAGGGSVEQLAKFQQTESQKWAKLIHDANIQLP